MNVQSLWQEIFKKALIELGGDALADITPVMAKPPKSDMGDLACPCFAYAKVLKKAPQQIASELAAIIGEHELGQAEAMGPYVNIRFSAGGVGAHVLSAIYEAPAKSYGKGTALAGIPIMIEFSSPNTNKPLHLGHLRNDSLGASVARILAFAGAEVTKVNLVNDRGMHICKSMLAYKKFGEGSTPESVGKKSDHFVGDYYVKYAQWAKEDPTADEQVQSMLQAWEEGDEEVLALWRQMNEWALSGLHQSYEATGIAFDKIYYESQTYKSGKSEVERGLKAGIFYQKEDGSVWVDLEPIGLDQKLLLRRDGTSVYLTQDLGTAIARHEDIPFEQLIYVVGNEQNYHFSVLFYVLGLLGYSWAKRLFHLSYGMVNLPDGKMKSREGTVVDADDLLADLTQLAKDEIIAKGRDSIVEDVDATSHAIALGALNYFLLQVQPARDMTFDPQESLSFTGNTGPYIQYTGARLCSLLAKSPEGLPDPVVERLDRDEERGLIAHLSEFPAVAAKAAEEYNSASICAYLYQLARSFSRYYHDVPILSGDDKELIASRLYLVEAVRRVLETAMELVGIPFLAVM